MGKNYAWWTKARIVFIYQNTRIYIYRCDIYESTFIFSISVWKYSLSRQNTHNMFKKALKINANAVCLPHIYVGRERNFWTIFFGSWGKSADNTANHQRTHTQIKNACVFFLVFPTLEMTFFGFCWWRAEGWRNRKKWTICGFSDSLSLSLNYSIFRLSWGTVRTK